MAHTLSGLRYRAGATLLCVFGLVALADLLFFEHPIGWALGGFGLLLTLWLWLRCGRKRTLWPVTLMALAGAGASLSMIEQPTVLASALLMTTLVALSISARRGWIDSLLGWIHEVAVWCLLAGFHPLIDFTLYCRCVMRRRSTRGLARLALWVLPLVLGGVFVVLFAIANPVVEMWFEELFGYLEDQLYRLHPERVLFWIVLAVSLWGLARSNRHYRYRQIKQTARIENTMRRFGVGPVMVRCLIVFNAVFAVQTALDTMYLFGSAELPEGMTYAQYAHRGAYPLIGTAILAAAFVLITFRPAVQDAPGARLIRQLVYLWIAQNIILLISAVYRLELYIDAYQLTRLRVAAAIWMGLVASGFFWIALRIMLARSNRWLVTANALTAGVVLVGCCFVNFDRFIAQHNVTHCAEMTGRGQHVDITYLEHLGYDALPALVRLRQRLDSPCPPDLNAYAWDNKRIETTQTIADAHARGGCDRVAGLDVAEAPPRRRVGPACA